MEASRFDRLTKSLTEAGTRRRLLGALATVPVIGSLAEALDEEVAKSRKGKGKRSRSRRDEHDLAQEGRKKGKKGKKKKRGGRGATTQPSTTPPPGNGGTCDDLTFAACFAPWLNDWETQVGGCAEACAAGANATCEQCLDTAITPLVDPFTHCYAQACEEAARSHRAGGSNHQARAAAAGCNPAELSLCQTRWLLQWLTADIVAASGFGVPGLLSAIAADIGSSVLDTCQQQYGCPNGQECQRLASGGEGVCCATCQRYDPSSQTCVPSCAADEACNAFGQCRKTCKRCYDYLINGRQMPCGQITNNCGNVLTCNGCASTERCQNRRCVPKSCAPDRSRAADDACCLPQTCQELGQTCGEWPDGCGGVLDCGPCQCVPDTCDPNFPTCNIPDGCGGTLNCCHEGWLCNTTDYEWDLCCKPQLCDGQGPGSIYDQCMQVCRACAPLTPEEAAEWGACPYPGGWIQG